MARRKSIPATAPSTIGEATALLGRYAEILTLSEELKANADISIAQIQAARDDFIKPLEEELKDLFIQLRSWWAVAGDAVTDGKRKSTEIAGCVLGLRTTPPSLKTPKGHPVDALIETLLENDCDGFVATSHKLNKPAIITTLRADPDDNLSKLLTSMGFIASQRDEFFIDRARVEPVAPASVVEAPENQRMSS